MQLSRARREQGCERYLLLETGVFANTLHSGALDQSILAHGIRQLLT